WTRFLGLKKNRGMDDQPLSVLDNCRITWGTVVSRAGDDVEVMCQGLASDGQSLSLAPARARRLDVWADGYSAVPDVAVGDEVAVHWGRLCGRLSGEQVRALAQSTERQLRVTSQRLAHV
ncbi:MAG: DUF6390 family protein, partial [Mycobacterium sp.]